MIDIFERGSEGNGQSVPRSQSFTQLSSTELKSSLPKQTVTSGPMIASVSGGSLLQPFLGQQIAPIATPLVFSGISQDSLNLFGAGSRFAGANARFSCGRRSGNHIDGPDN